MERLKHIKESILCCVENEVSNLSSADTKELGEAIDMLKDLEEAIYYATITKAMNSGEEKHTWGDGEVMYYPRSMSRMYPTEDGKMYFPEKGETGHYMIYFDPYRDMDRERGKMYYSGEGSPSSSRMYTEREYPYPIDMRDRREGRSPASRKTYMEAKEMHHGKEVQLKELEKYMQELTNDMVEMIKESSPEEKQFLQKKIATLAEKVGQVNV